MSVTLVLEQHYQQVEGVSKGATYSSTRTLQPIALAEYETLLPKALNSELAKDSLRKRSHQMLHKLRAIALLE